MKDTSRLFNHKLHLTLNSLQLARSKDLLEILVNGNKEGNGRDDQEELNHFLKELESLLTKFQDEVERVDKLLTDTISIVSILP